MSILKEAQDIRNGARAVDYGDAVVGFELIAQIASLLLGKEVTAKECCTILIALKLSREAHAHKRDNLVDLCGYADILQLIHEKEETI